MLCGDTHALSSLSGWVIEVHLVHLKQRLFQKAFRTFEALCSIGESLVGINRIASVGGGPGSDLTGAVIWHGITHGGGQLAEAWV